MKIPPAGRRIDEGRIAVDDLAIANLDQPNGTRARRIAVGSFEVDGGEVQRHGSSLPAKLN